MRVALVSPYSWTYPGGVTRHIEALADELGAAGHEVRILAPSDPDDRTSELLHRGARPQVRPADPRLMALGRTVGFPANGAVSNLAPTPGSVTSLRRMIEAEAFDVVHVHEPIAPLVGWDALCSVGAPLVGTFHCYSTNAVSNGAANLLGARRRLNRLRVRIAVSEAAAWTGERFYGGRYRIIPNGVALPATARAATTVEGDDGAPLRILFVGQGVERKGLSVLLRAFEALRDHVPATLTIVGAGHDEVAPLLLDGRGVLAVGKVDDERKRVELAGADVLCAPSLGGESFGMVLTEAFAAGTPVIASDLPGYAEVVRDRIDGLLLPRGDASALAEALRELALDRPRCRALGRAAAQRAERYAWPRVAEEVLEAYADAIAVPQVSGRVRRGAVNAGLVPGDLGPRRPPRRLPSLEPAPEPGVRPGLALARRAGLAVASVAGLVLALFAVSRIGLDRVAGSLLASSPVWVLAGLGLMCSSMVLRGLAWHSILRAALPGSGVRRIDALQGTFIGVLMSATLPARLGEPSRALIVARRLGRARSALPVVLGTLVSQTLLNLVALLVLGIVMFSSLNLFDGHHAALLLVAVGPLAIALSLVMAPALVPRGARSRSARLHGLLVGMRAALVRVRAGLSVFGQPRLAIPAVAAQLSAWAIQWIACYVLLVALGLDGRAGLGAAAGVLFAVNVTAALPATPSNVGIFQAACVVVLTGAYHVSSADALGYGIILQAVEIATAVVMGMPALVKEGLSWRDVRLRALHAAPVELGARGGAVGRRGTAEAEA